MGREGLALGEGVLKNLKWLAERLVGRPSSLVHADLRADNLLFGEPDSADEVVIVDWQLATRSLAANDPTRLLGGSEPASQRNGHHLEVFTAWHETLLEHGVTGYEFDEVLDDFRLGALFNLLVPVMAYGMTVGTTSVRTGPARRRPGRPDVRLGDRNSTPARCCRRDNDVRGAGNPISVAQAPLFARLGDRAGACHERIDDHQRLRLAVRLAACGRRPIDRPSLALAASWARTD